MVPTEVPSRDQNIRYLQTKKDRMDHRLVLDTQAAEPVTALPSAGQGPFQHEQD